MKKFISISFCAVCLFQATAFCQNVFIGLKKEITPGAFPYGISVVKSDSLDICEN
jgi:hypothetical protein